MNRDYNFANFKNTIRELSYSKQLKSLIEARTEYIQNVNPGSTNSLGNSFDKKCNLEIEKIKELMELDQFNFNNTLELTIPKINPSDFNITFPFSDEELNDMLETISNINFSDYIKNDNIHQCPKCGQKFNN